MTNSDELHTLKGAASALPQVEHEYTLHEEAGTSKIWATLKIRSYAKKPEDFPVFFEGSTVEGDLTINTESPKSFKEISVTVQGRLVVLDSGPETGKFFHETHQLWHESSHDKRLAGEHKFPFSIHIPQKCIPQSHFSPSIMHEISLPPSFMEKNVFFSSIYDILVSFKSHLLSTTHAEGLGSRFVYFKVTNAPPMSQQRTKAYEMKSTPPDPSLDPEGWITHGAVTFTQKDVNGKTTEVKVTCSIAAPGVFNHGTFIPLHLSIECADQEILKSVSAPSKIKLILLRQLKTEQNEQQTVDYVGTFANESDLQHPRSIIQKATWTTAPQMSDKPNNVNLFGEVALSPMLQPTYNSALFEINYALSLLPFDDKEVGNFDSLVHEAKDAKSHLFEIPVSITSAQGTGPAPVPITEPVYDQPILLARTNDVMNYR